MVMCPLFERYNLEYECVNALTHDDIVLLVNLIHQKVENGASVPIVKEYLDLLDRLQKMSERKCRK